MEMVEVDGLQIAYERVGTGPALVLLHGYVGDGPITWRRQLDALSDEFTVVAWDAPGAGRSTDPPGWFGLDGYADCLAGFLDKLGLDSACVVGLFRWHPRPCAPAATPGQVERPNPGVGIRGLGRFAAPRGRRAAPSSGARLGRWHAEGVRRCLAADDVLQDDAA
jgi:pimeloyl-ACP methyl ester carboxylesterase